MNADVRTGPSTTRFGLESPRYLRDSRRGRDERRSRRVARVFRRRV